MRLLIYYRPKVDKFILNYTEDRQHPLKVGSINCYGHVIIQYWYIEDKKVFFTYKNYKKYLDKKYKRRLSNLRHGIGQAIIKFGQYVCYGKQEKTKVIYVYRYPWWK